MAGMKCMKCGKQVSKAYFVAKEKASKHPAIKGPLICEGCYRGSFPKEAVPSGAWVQQNPRSIPQYVGPQPEPSESRQQRMSLSSESAIAKIERIADKKKTTGHWFAWGPSKYMEQWVEAGESKRIKQHALGMKGGAHSPQGPGLYLASAMWRSSTYAKEDSCLLIATLQDVPTIDVREREQMRQLEEGLPSLKEQDLYEKDNLADILFIYTKAGTYGRLSTNTGVELTTDLRKLDLAYLKDEAKKLAIDAQPAFEMQAKKCGLSL